MIKVFINIWSWGSVLKPWIGPEWIWAQSAAFRLYTDNKTLGVLPMTLVQLAQGVSVPGRKNDTVSRP